jgi:hypothetical protein
MALGRPPNEGFDVDVAARFFLREGAGIGASDFHCLAFRGKQLKYSLN